MNKLLTNFPVTLTEEQKNVLKLTLSAVLQDDPITKYWRPTVYENGDIMWALVASESEPTSQNIKGPSGFTPQFQIDQSTAEWQVTYDGTNWTPLGIIASGAQGPQGASGTPGKDGTNGTNGTDGTSIYLKSVTDAQGGKQVTLGWGTSDTSAFVIPSGAAGTPGTNGTDGVSPTVTTSEIGPTTEHPQGGTSVTITDKTGPNQFNVWNGINGQGATVNLLEGTGIKITENGTNYTIGVSADYALKSELPDLTDYATKTYANEASANALSEAESWVEGKHYLTAVPDDYATKTYANEASANALGQAETWVGQQGYLKQSALNGYATETYADTASAEALSQAKSWVNLQNFATSAGLAANKQYAMTTNGWSDFAIPSIPDITPSNGLSANGHTVGISNAGIATDKQYAWTQQGWEEVAVPSTSGYLPTSGGTVSGQLVVSGSNNNFDDYFLKIIRGNVNGYARLGLGQYGALALKTDDSNSHTTQVNISPNASNNELVQVQHNGGTIGYLIPATTATTTAGLTNDGILHIILES